MKKQKGITLVALVITIVILIIIASITIYEGKDIIAKSELENLKTNMLLIKAKAKEYAENANFKLGVNIDTLTGDTKTNRIEEAKKELKGKIITSNNETTNKLGIVLSQENNYIYYYELDQEDLNLIGLNSVKLNKDERYIIKYDIKDVKIEIYNSIGFEYNDKIYYSLTDLESEQLDI